MTDKERTIGFLASLKIFERDDNHEEGFIDYGDSIMIGPCRETQKMVRGDFWGSFEFCFDRSGRFEKIEISGD